MRLTHMERRERISGHQPWHCSREQEFKHGNVRSNWDCKISIADSYITLWWEGEGIFF